MTIDEQISLLHASFPQFDRLVIRDTDNRGNEFCETILQNKKMPSLPLTVCVTERGCSISVGPFENVTGSDMMTVAETCSAIGDILEDKIVFVQGYKDDSDTGFGAPIFKKVFALTGGIDDMSPDYEYFIKKISTPLTKLSRLFSNLKGRFVIFNFSGSINREIIR